MPSDQAGIQRHTVPGLTAADHREGLHRGQTESAQVAEEFVLTLRDIGLDFLDREYPAREVDEADDMATDAAGKCGKDVRRPVLQGGAPRQVKQGRIGSGSGEAV